MRVAEEITSTRRYTHLRNQLRATSAGRRLLRERPLINQNTVDYAGLRKLPPGSFGHSYVHFLDDNGIDCDEMTIEPETISDEEVAYVLCRQRQTHDLWHTLIGLGTSPHEEVLIQTFTWAQTRLPFSGLVVFFGSFKHLIGESRWATLLHGLKEAYSIGLQAPPLLPVKLEERWEQPIDALRLELGLRIVPRWCIDLYD